LFGAGEVHHPSVVLLDSLTMKVSLVSLLSAVAVVAVAADCAVNDNSKADCGYVGITQAGCESKGCCWQESSNSAIPWCFYQSGVNSNCFGYQVRYFPHASFETKCLRLFILIDFSATGGDVDTLLFL
jgi:hypothetical protein